MNALQTALERPAERIADHLALAIARIWCRGRPLAPRLVPSRVGVLVNISFTVDASTEIDDVTSRLTELVTELRDARLVRHVVTEKGTALALAAQ
ncbi:MAG: hypothetical protein GIX02_12080 [Candidatus Eremiobacteraeota bacterium]|nr:hypothetical protein [Candidatus Eremiobacteraeota bacterium]